HRLTQCGLVGERHIVVEELQDVAPAGLAQEEKVLADRTQDALITRNVVGRRADHHGKRPGDGAAHAATDGRIDEPNPSLRGLDRQPPRRVGAYGAQVEYHVAGTTAGD